DRIGTPGSMLVESLAVAGGTPGIEAETWFTWGEDAVADTFTVTVMTGSLAPAASASLREQVLPGEGQVQPVPAIETSVSPEGTVSVTVIVPLVGALPVFDTVTV